MSELSSDQLKTLRHMLGIDDPYQRVPKPYRDYFCASPGDANLIALEQAGAVRRYAEQGGYWWYETTPEGHKAAIASHRTTRAPKRQRIYLKYLQVSDVFSDLTFRQFLTSPEFADTRREA